MSLYDIVTKKIMQALERGVIPWRRPWDSTEAFPINAITQKPYRGINPFLLTGSSFSDHRWLTFKQASELGGTVKKGEQGRLVVFWKGTSVEEDEHDEQVRRPPILRYYNVFNAQQCEGLGLPELPPKRAVPESERLTKAQLLIDLMPNLPKIVKGGTVATYFPRTDHIRIPAMHRFDTVDSYYQTLYHELAHATGHETRLARKGIMEVERFGSEGYSQEELVAEFGAAYCCAAVGLDNSYIEDAASYIDSWLNVLDRQPAMLVYAAAQAQRAADYIRGVTYS